MKWQDPSTFTLTFGDITTGAISADATAQEVQDALNALPLIKSRVAKTTDGFHIDFIPHGESDVQVTTLTMV